MRFSIDLDEEEFKKILSMIDDIVRVMNEYYDKKVIK